MGRMLFAKSSASSIDWSEDYPSVEDFIRFLEKPIAMKNFYCNLKEAARAVNKINDDDDSLHFLDYPLVRDPFEEESAKLFNTINSFKKNQ
ncbi:hypothetical protein QFZ81_004013 [Paenibacillus sp. V4I9]|uniref:hypothetical protein n=1 Tax=Paenibacillus sp. V4I9 TaxID=3042308 RepID=UPI0027808A09|nr:hypothetical protein [Paenibacillus sp. V4I9]MDQ0888925.1 hypothetical protein [Paenibacillus sp. V4I9]